MTTGTFTSPLTPRARAVSCAAWPAGLLIAGWPNRSAQSFDGSAFHACTVPTDTAVVSGHGYVAAAVDSAGTGWLLSSEGTLDTAVLTGTPTSALLPQSTAPGSSLLYVGLAAIGPYVFALEGTTGRLFASQTGAGVEELQSFAGRATTLAAGSAGTLWALQPGLAQITGYAPATGATTRLASPMTYPDTLAASGSVVAVAGSNASTFASTASGFALASANGSSIIAVSSPEAGTVTTYIGTDPVWTAAGTATGLSAPADLCWTPDGEQILVGGSAGLTILQVQQSAPSVTQTFQVSGVGSIAVTPDGEEALVCQPGSGSITPFSASVGVWTKGSPVSVPSPQGVLIQSSILAYVLSGPNIVNLARTGSTWALGATVATLPFNIGAISAMPDATLYAIGNLNGTGYLAALNAAYAVTAQISWTGTADALTMLEGQVFVLDRTNGLIRAFGMVEGALVLEARRAAASVRGFGATADCVWLCGSTLQQMQSTGPFRLAAVRSGQISIWNGAWVNCALGTSREPACLTFDAYGTIWVATRENEILSLALENGALVVASSAALPIPSGQESTVPLGAAALCWSAGHLYAVTADSGIVLELV